MNDNKIAAVVIGLDINGLGVARWLAKEGVPVYAIDKNFKKPTGRTNSAKKVKFNTLEGEKFIEELIKLRENFDDNPVLFITMERTLRTISEYRDKISHLYRFTMPEHKMLMSLMNKNGVLQVAEKSGVRYPRTLKVTAPGIIDGAKNFTFPCIFKPSEQNTEFGDEIKKAYKTNSLDEIKQIYAEIKDRISDMVIQEWVEGNDSDIYFLIEYIDSAGNVVADFPGRKVRSWPPNVGGTASCTSAYELLDEMRIATAKYFKACNFIGMGGMEFKRDSRSGELLIIEPTVARTDLQHEVAMIHGVNLVYAQYCSETGQEFKTLSSDEQKNWPQKIWRVAPIDRYSRETVTTDAQDEIDKRYPSVEALARFSDPLPFIYSLCGKVSAKINHIIKR
ncbi:MAG: hypothetical protein JKY84_12380 [Emcibacteraceae bacterium]|nr:hypothetical protein [Emcibacteraceae bacterium]